MADNFQLQGVWSTQPLGAPSSLLPALTTPIQESLVLQAKQASEPLLSSDAPVAVNFGGVASANVVILKVKSGGPVIATVSTLAGASQVVYFDTYLILMNATNPVTALSLTRTPSVLSQVEVFLGQKA